MSCRVFDGPQDIRFLDKPKKKINPENREALRRARKNKEN